MSLALILPWFPIVLAVGVAGRLLGRTWSWGVGILCALFWVVLVRASESVPVAYDLWTLATFIAGGVAIVAVSVWSGTIVEVHGVSDTSATRPLPIEEAQEPEGAGALQGLSELMVHFDDWLETHREIGVQNAWAEFGEFIRTALHRCCKATHVKPFAVVNEGRELMGLCEADPSGLLPRIPAREGIVGHVLTTGRMYVAGDTLQGGFIEELARRSQSEPPAWCFSVTQGTRRLGVVVVGGLDTAPARDRAQLHAAGRLIGQCWCLLLETLRSGRAIHEDPVSGLDSRETFLRLAEQSLRQSYARGEPVAVAVVTLEGLRALNDSGHWDVADELVGEVSRMLRWKLRADDGLGRFDGSRFVLLLRRVDSELASLIMDQLTSRLAELCEERERWRTQVSVRCGLAGSGTGQPDLRTLVSEALTQCTRARREQTRIASDMPGSLRTCEAKA